MLYLGVSGIAPDSGVPWRERGDRSPDNPRFLVGSGLGLRSVEDADQSELHLLR